MVNIDATTPQLKAVKRWLEGYTSRDMDEVASVISKDFTFQSFPRTIDIPEEAKGAHIQKYKPILAALSKLEVRIHRWITVFKLADLHLPPLA